MNKILDISSLTIGYEDNPPILEDINLQVYEKDFLGIIGPNGGGKTTLLKAVMGLISPRSGKISFYKHGKPENKINIGYLPQINEIDKNFPISVYEVILSGLTLKKKFFIRYTGEQKEKVISVAGKMGVAEYLHSPIGKLSGGQLQRTLLGRAIVSEPDLLILDEPNSYVDKRFETNFYQLLQEINKNTSIVLVSHDVGTVISMVKNIACVNRGIHYHAGSDITTDWLEEYYVSCPIEILGHGKFPHRVLEQHDNCECCNKDNNK